MVNRRLTKLFAVLLLLVVSAPGMSQNTTVYKHVNENGVVTFSDTPPAENVETETVSIATSAPQDPNQYLRNLNAMRESTDRMVADRQDREKHRAEMRQLNAETAAREPAPAEPYRDYVDIWPVYGGPIYGRPSYPGRPPWRPGYRPKPEHPIARPPYPVRPTVPVTGGNSQLMRPINTTPRR